MSDQNKKTYNWYAREEFYQCWPYIVDPNDPAAEPSPELAIRVLNETAALMHTTLAEVFLEKTDAVECSCGRTNMQHYRDYVGEDGEETDEFFSIVFESVLPMEDEVGVLVEVIVIDLSGYKFSDFDLSDYTID